MSHPAAAAVQEQLRRLEQLPFHATIGDLVAAAAAREPDRPACVFFERGEELTRAGLDRAANRAANALRAIGVRRGSRVAVMLPNRIEYPVVWIGLARLGATMVPINNGYTPREIAYALTDAETTFAVVDESCLATFLAAPERPATLDAARIAVVGGAAPAGMASWSALVERSSDAFAPTELVTGDDPVSIQYTSGTTGMPKGCLLPQSYWLVLCRAAGARMHSPVKRMLVQNLFFYMNAQFMLLTALTRGATLYVAERPSASRFIGWIKTLGIHWCVFPEFVLKQPPARDDDRTALMEVAIAAWSRDGHREVERRFNVRAREIFGMTECGPGTFMPWECDDMVGSGSIGVPSLFRRVRVRGIDGGPVAPGETGELQVTGPSMLKCYVNKPEATARSFDGHWFRTGDLARQDEHGFFYIAGRIKDMIRRAGENIAAVEIESVVRQVPDVVDAAVSAVPDDDRGEEVRIVVERGPDGARDGELLERIIAHCERNLARFKVPRYYGFVETLPRTASNKVAKHLITPAGTDPCAGMFDRTTGTWLAHRR